MTAKNTTTLLSEYASALADIDDYIVANGTELITGPILNMVLTMLAQVLQDTINSLVNAADAPPLTIVGPLTSTHGFIGSGSGGASSYTAAQIPTTHFTALGVTSFFSAGYATVGDRGMGAPYTSVGATSSGPGAVQDADGHYWNLVVSGQRVNVGWFGAVGNFVTDDTAAMQRAHNTQLQVYYPAGIYLFTSTISMNGGGVIGDGSCHANTSTLSSYIGATILYNPETDATDAITWVGNYQHNNMAPFRDFALWAFAKTGGYGINVNPVGLSPANNMVFDNLFITARNGMNIQYSGGWMMTNCYFACSKIGLEFSNFEAPDDGDAAIVGCNFQSYGVNTDLGNIGILQHNSGGLKISSTKIIGWGYCYQLNISGGATSDLEICGCGFENSQYGIAFINTVGTSVSFVNIAITGNQFAGNGTDCWFGLLPAGDTNNWANICITGNTFRPGVYPVYLQNCAAFIVSGNSFFTFNSATGNGIYIDATCTSGRIGHNTFGGGYPQNILNNSTSTAIVIDNDVQLGTATATTGTTYGSFFSAIGSVTFPVAFGGLWVGSTAQPPVVSAWLEDASGTALAVTVSAITTTGFSFTVIGTTTGEAIAIGWRAEGIEHR